MVFDVVAKMCLCLAAVVVFGGWGLLVFHWKKAAAIGY